MKYNIIGGQLPVVICDVDMGETLITECGSMSWMSPNMKMETVGGGIGKALGRFFTGESLFINHYTAMGGAGQIAFASSFPGAIKVFEITPDKPMIVQKRSFLASESTVSVSAHFSRKLGTGLFGGEGFIMQKLSGNGTAFVEIDGHCCEYMLAAGQSMVVSTGYLAAMDATCSIDVATVQGAKNVLFGGEGLFNTVVTGPGRVYLQTMPIFTVAAAISPYVATGN